MEKDERYAAAAEMLGSTLGEILLQAPATLQHGATEIRLREGRPLCVMIGTCPHFLTKEGGIEENPSPEGLTRREIQDALVTLCGWAVHAHQKELAEGFIAVRGGHRAGLGATAVVQDGVITGVRDITSINLRIAREIYGVADTLITSCFSISLVGLLIAGEPASGKTTVLRDLARQLAGKSCGYRKICVVDESGEIGGASGGAYANNLGMTTDLLFGYPKAKGLQIAVRYLSPQVIICDEIGTQEEISAVAAAANSGVAVVTSIHGATLEELRHKPQLKPLLQTGAFSNYALLAGASTPSVVASIGKAEELCRC